MLIRKSNRRVLAGIRRFVIGCICGVSSNVAVAAEPKISERDRAFFESKVRPILVERCYACHSTESDQVEGDFALDTATGLRKGGKSGPAIVEGQPERSLLILSVRHQKPAEPMPPIDADDKLTAQEISILEQWVRLGAPDPRRANKQKPNEWERTNEELLQSWWAYQRINEPVLPGDGNEWSEASIDRFIFAKLAENRIKPVAAADPTVLLRRVYYDLIGLPPTAAQIVAFEDSLNEVGLDEAYSAVVDQLLASDQFGMHWGRHWLDVARYAESSGKEVNLAYPHAWRYRNWVIEAFNEDMPYNAFLKQQIAGDLLPAKSSSQSAEQLIATGFLAIGTKSLNEMNPQQFAVDQADEQIDTVFQATMATTFACARCHDHKFDPISQREYTAVAGVFLSTETHYGTTGRNNNAKNVASLKQLPADAGLPILSRRTNSNDIGQQRQELNEKEAELQNLRRRIAQEVRKNGGPNQKAIREIRELSIDVQRLKTLLAEYDDQGRLVPVAMCVEDKPQTSQQVQFVAAMRKERNRQIFDSLTNSPLYARGEIELAGDEVPRSVPTLFGASSRFEIPVDQSGRLQLADWIVQPKNPLTARVAVNRIWGWIFGDAIVDTVDNFGPSGSLPSHPELLDYLATTFIKSGWKQKALIREIVLSKTYRLSSQTNAAALEIDPDNELFWRANRKRLPAEAIHDSILLAAGELDQSVQIGSEIARQGDGPVRIGDDSKQKPGPGKFAQRFLRRQEEKPGKGVRAVFMAFPRGETPEIFELFDGADGSVVQGQRDVTSVPLQSLYLLNSPDVQRYATELAAKAFEASDKQRDAVIDDLFIAILSRNPTKEEQDMAIELLNELNGDKVQALASLAKSLFATAEFLYLD